MRRARVWMLVGLAALLAACGVTDTAAPSVSITAPADGSVVTSGAVTVSGTASDNVGVVAVEVFVDGTSVGTTVPASGIWSLVWDAGSVGAAELTATASDAAGNETTSAAVNVTVDAATLEGSVSGYITRFAPDPILAPAAAPAMSAIVPGGVFVAFHGGTRPETRFATNGFEGGFTFQADGGFSFDGVAFEQLRAFPTASGLAFYQAEGLDEAATLALVQRMKASSAVADVFPNLVVTADQVTPDDPAYAAQAWHYEQLNLPFAWEIEDGSTSRVNVAVLDTGAYLHDELEWSAVGANFVAAEGDIDEPLTLAGGSPHGTHVAGTIGALTNNAAGVAGVNWNVELIPVKVLGAAGSGSLLGILDGVYWAAGFESEAFGEHVNPNPAAVVNLSLGAVWGDICPPTFDQVFQEVQEATGTIAVVSAGNDGGTSDGKLPASCEHVISVGATGPTGARAYYSNVGAFVDVFAPGGDADYEHPVLSGSFAGVLSTYSGNSFALMQGTSMAAPHVSGVVALMLAQEPDLTLAQVRERLHNASQPMSVAQCWAPVTGFEGLNPCGAGLLDAAAALAGETLVEPQAFAYAIPFVGGTAPELGLGQLAGLAATAAYQTEAELTEGGDFSFELTGLPDGDYLIVGVEMRDPANGISGADRVGAAEVSIADGGAATAVVVVDPVYFVFR